MGGQLLYKFLGWIYLRLRYRTEEKREEILKSKFSGSYHFVGSTIVFYVTGIPFLILLLAMWVLLVFAAIKEMYKYFLG